MRTIEGNTGATGAIPYTALTVDPRCAKRFHRHYSGKLALCRQPTPYRDLLCKYIAGKSDYNGQTGAIEGPLLSLHTS